MIKNNNLPKQKFKKDEYQFKIYLKKIKKPFILLLDDKKYFDKFFEDIKTNSFVKIGNIIINIENFNYGILEMLS